MAKDEHFNFDVFLSYSHENTELVRPLAEGLRTGGLKVWFDEWIIQPGDNIVLAVEKGMAEARTLVFCLSPAAVMSSWAALERSIAIIRDPSNANRRFIPILLVDLADLPMPDILTPYMLVDFRQDYERALYELIAACSGVSTTTSGGDSGTKPTSTLDDFWHSLSPELKRAFEQHLNHTKRLGPEDPDNEDDYIDLRRGFLKDRKNLLEELFQRIALCHPERIDLPEQLDLQWMEARHEVGRIFLEKRRGTEALELLDGMQELIERCDDATRSQHGRRFAKMLDSIGEAIRFGPERDTKRAKHLFELALSLSHHDHFALKHLGTIYRMEHSYDEAEACFKRALAVKETHHVHFSLGYLYSEWEDRHKDRTAMAKEQYDACEKALKTNEIVDYYRVYIKKTFLALRQRDVRTAVSSAGTALTVLNRSLSDDYVEVNRFAADFLLAILSNSLDKRALRLRCCEEYLRAELDGMSFSVFDCVYRDLKREIDNKESLLSAEVAGLRKDQRDLSDRVNRIIDTLRLKESLFLRQKQNWSLIRNGSSVATVFPRLDGEIVIYLKVLPGRDRQILPALEPFHEIQTAAETDPYSLKLSFESITPQSAGALRQVSNALELLLDHAALAALDKADSTHFDFNASLWRPFTALVSPSLQRSGFPDHFSLPEMHGRNSLVRIFSSKLIGADSGRRKKRVFLNPRVGCSVGCSFCYLPAYGIPIDRARKEIDAYAVDIDSLGCALDAKRDCFIPGSGGSLLSVGSFTEPFLAPAATLELLCSLASFGNPLQIATRLSPHPEVIQQLAKDLGTEADHLMINLSMNKPDEGVKGVIDKWLLYKGELNVAIYAKPFMDRTMDCFDYFKNVGNNAQDVSFIVGSLYFGDKVGLSPSELRNHHLEPALRSPVVAHSTTPGMRNNAEESFRLRLQESLGRTVFRTSSCALAAKMRIPDPLGNFDGPFCVAGCSNRSICSAAHSAPPTNTVQGVEEPGSAGR